MVAAQRVASPEQQPVLKQVLVETVRLLDRFREEAWEAWLDSRESEADSAKTAARDKVRGNPQYLKMALTCLERRCQLLDVKALAHSNPAVTLEVLEHLPLDVCQAAELRAAAATLPTRAMTSAEPATSAPEMTPETATIDGDASHDSPSASVANVDSPRPVAAPPEGVPTAPTPAGSDVPPARWWTRPLVADERGMVDGHQLGLTRQTRVPLAEALELRRIDAHHRRDHAAAAAHEQALTELCARITPTAATASS